MVKMRRGMTFIELLIVIAIITVLAGLSMAVLMRARKRVYVTNCINNLRQLIQAVHMYEDDWGTVPIEKPTKTPEGTYGKVQQMISPYVKNDNVFLCPADFTGGRMAYSESYATDAFGQPVPYPDPKDPNPDSVYWNGKWWLTSYTYPINFLTVQIYGKGNTRLKPECPIFWCPWHCYFLRADIIARYDGSVVISASAKHHDLLFED
jgi:prepilin-type N-terminal cleavage/methylation domain-containing protein